jgi:hypothetical protein
MWAFAFGARTGVRMTLMFPLARSASKARGNFASRSWIRNRIGWSRSSKFHQEVPRLLQHPRRIRLARERAVLDAPTADGDEGEYIEAAQPDRVYGEEITGEDRLAVRSEETAARG